MSSCRLMFTHCVLILLGFKSIVFHLKIVVILVLGMKPLLYSEREATARGLGWKRAGSHISYCKTTLYKNPLLQREYVYYTLTFHMVSN